MGDKRRCLKFKIVKSKSKLKGKAHFVARCVEFQNKAGKPVCPAQGLVTWGRSQAHIRTGRFACRGVETRHSATSNATLNKKPKTKKSKR